ncbi:MAG: thermonuclease family protein [Alphaproteobacteria bacterium]|nr:thermonuclease family protein [Alphaproteobacteria bacterium]MCB9928692.1 thermonuclease family protein [Alphaproteobacteria bacterium]
MLGGSAIGSGRAWAGSPVATLPPWQSAPEIGTARVAAVSGGDRLMLDDGRTLVLAGLRAPRDAEGERPAEPGFAAAREHLAGLVQGRTLRLFAPADGRDRLGRTVAHALVAGPRQQWLQAVMLRDGFARVYAPARTRPAIARALLAEEAAARAAGRGLWRLPDFAIRDAATPERIGPGFALVDGRVLAIGETAHTLFLNFGPDRRTDFSALVERRDRDGFAQGLRGLRALEGRRVRVRGMVFRYGGPAIRVRSDRAIELLEEQP